MVTRVRRNGVDADEWEKENFLCQKLRTNNIYKSIYFQFRSPQNEIQTAEVLSVASDVYRDPLFRFVWTF
jgi:hypothetical protein